MTETARIRWERNEDDNSLTGRTGTMTEPVFWIYPPESPGKAYILTAMLPGHTRDFYPSGFVSDLKAKAEEWLAGFVSSLGAGFPGGHPEGNAIEAYCATETEDGDDRHLLQYAVRLPDGTTTAYGDQSWVRAGLAARDNDGASTVVRDIWLSYGPWRTHETTAPERS